MRLSKTALTFLAIGIFVVLAASLLMAYFQEGEEQSQLSQELSSVQLLLAKQWSRFSSEELPSQRSELESQLALAESELSTAKASLRQQIESIEVTDTLFEVAETNEVTIVQIENVEIVGIDPPGLPEEDLDEVSFLALSFKVKIEGDLPNQINFISELSERFPTSVNDLTEIDVVESLATARLYIYTYEGN